MPAPRPAGRHGTDVRKRALALFLASFYAVLVWAVALVLSTYLYQTLHQLAYSRYLPDPRSAQPETATVDEGRGPSQAAAEPGLGAQPGPTSSLHVGHLAEDLPSRKRVNILLLGTDERPNEDGPPRTDTMMVVTLDLEHGIAGMISLPRDLWVPIPGYDITTKINTAYVLGEKLGYPGGGAQLAKDTVSSFLGQPIHYYVKVNFHGFVRFVDLIGGVTVEVPKTIHDEQYPTEDYGTEVFHLEAGLQQLDGATALKYVRTRNVDNDYARAERQQQVLQAILDKVLAADMIPTLIARAPELMATMRDSFDTDLPLPLAIQLANYIRTHPFQEIRRLVLDNRYGTESFTDDGAWVLLPDRAAIRQALDEFFQLSPEFPLAQGQPNPDSVAGLVADQMGDPAPSNPARVTRPGLARVEILNGVSYPDIAARMQAELEARGWQVVTVGEAERPTYQRTLIVNYHADPSLVAQLQADLGLGQQLPVLNGLIPTQEIDIRIVIGQDYVRSVFGPNSP